MSYTSNYNLNIRLSNLESRINGGVPTSSNLADVLLNGNNAGATNIDMNGNEISYVSVIDNIGNGIYLGNGGADNINVRGTDSVTLLADGSSGGNTLNIEATNGDMRIETISGDINITASDAVSMLSADGISMTTSGNPFSLTANSVNIAMTATDDIGLTSTSDAINLNANLDINLTSGQGSVIITSTNDEINLTANAPVSIKSNTGNIELIPINDGVTESGIVRINKNNSLFGDGFLTAGTINISSDEIGNNISPQLTITNLYPTAGTMVGVPSVCFYKAGRIVNNNDRIGDFYFNAIDQTSLSREWARMEVVTRNVTVGNEDGSISFWASLNGVSTEFLRINGADGDNNFLRPLDMNGSSILSTSGSLSISASASSGAGTITITPKPLGNLIFQNLPTSAVGLPTGAVWNNLGVLNIAP